MGFTGYRTYTGNLDVWIVDYVRAARELQLSLYDQTNIVIDEETHVSAIDLALGTRKAYDSDDEEESTRNIFNYIPDVTIPKIEIPSYNIGDLFRPDREPTETEEYTEDEDNDSRTQEYTDYESETSYSYY